MSIIFPFARVDEVFTFSTWTSVSLTEDSLLRQCSFVVFFP